MSILLRFPNEPETRQRAALWIAQLDRGLSPVEVAGLRAWLDADRKHREVLLEMADLWDSMEVLGEISELFPLASSREPLLRSRWHWRSALLLIFPLLLIGAYFAFPLLQQRTFASEYRTRVGEQQTVNLPDHSVVMLNTATRMRVEYTDGTRRIDLLQGEAHFQVAKNRQRVFTVHAGANEFTAVGTAFDVRIGPDRGTDLTVTEGRVQVLVLPSTRTVSASPATTEIMVDAGKEVAIGSATQTVRRLEPAQLDAALAWRHGMIVFDGRPLEEAVREVSRYSSTQFRIEQDEIRRLPVSGYFKIGDIEALNSALRANFNIETTREGDWITLRTPSRSADSTNNQSR